jgi:hypothetical protein
MLAQEGREAGVQVPGQPGHAGLPREQRDVEFRGADGREVQLMVSGEVHVDPGLDFAIELHVHADAVAVATCLAIEAREAANAGVEAIRANNHSRLHVAAAGPNACRAAVVDDDPRDRHAALDVDARGLGVVEDEGVERVAADSPGAEAVRAEGGAGDGPVGIEAHTLERAGTGFELSEEAGRGDLAHTAGEQALPARLPTRVVYRLFEDDHAQSRAG